MTAQRLSSVRQDRVLPRLAGEGSAATFSWRAAANGIAIIAIDAAGKRNTLDGKSRAQLAALLDEVEACRGLTGVVIHSGKRGSFLVGPDGDEISALQSAGEATTLVLETQALLARIERFCVPVIAAIEGACLGAGLELALACRGRVAAGGGATVFGMTQAQLGLLPAGGGTQRLPRRIGIAHALDLLIGGRMLKPRQALTLGLIDAVVAPPELLHAAVDLALTHTGNRARARRSWKDRLTRSALEANPLGRALLFRQARARAARKTQGNYPAIPEIIDAVEIGWRLGVDAGYAAEARAFGVLAQTPQSLGLRSLARASELLKETAVARTGVRAPCVHEVGVLGAGLMGAGIAVATLDKAGCMVHLKDRDERGLAKGRDYVDRHFDSRVRRGSLSRSDADRKLERLSGGTSYFGFSRCDLVIEAVFEDLKLKKQVLDEIEALGREDIIFGSNTSSIPISSIAAGARRPENVIGLHYFSPVEKMPLLEIITTPQTAPRVTAACVALGKAQGKTVIVVQDAPGFYTTRVLAPYLNEATRMVVEGVDPRAIDRALVRFGYPVGAVTLLDEVGIDVGLKVGPMLRAAFGERLASPDGAEAIIAAGSYGRKSGKGFYVYAGGKAVRTRAGKKLNRELFDALQVAPGSLALEASEIAGRCAFLQVNEAAHCLADGVLAEPMHGDVGAVLGLGFPPFTGGPFRFIDAYGVERFVARLETLAQAYGPRFAPAPLLLEMARTRRRFHRD